MKPMRWELNVSRTLVRSRGAMPPALAGLSPGPLGPCFGSFFVPDGAECRKGRLSRSCNLSRFLPSPAEALLSDWACLCLFSDASGGVLWRRCLFPESSLDKDRMDAARSRRWPEDVLRASLERDWCRSSSLCFLACGIADLSRLGRDDVACLRLLLALLLSRGEGDRAGAWREWRSCFEGALRLAEGPSVRFPPSALLRLLSGPADLVVVLLEILEMLRQEALGCGEQPSLLLGLP